MATKEKLIKALEKVGSAQASEQKAAALRALKLAGGSTSASLAAAINQFGEKTRAKKKESLLPIFREIVQQLLPARKRKAVPLVTKTGKVVLALPKSSNARVLWMMNKAQKDPSKLTQPIVDVAMQGYERSRTGYGSSPRVNGRDRRAILVYLIKLGDDKLISDSLVSYAKGIYQKHQDPERSYFGRDTGYHRDKITGDDGTIRMLYQVEVWKNGNMVGKFGGINNRRSAAAQAKTIIYHMIKPYELRHEDRNLKVHEVFEPIGKNKKVTGYQVLNPEEGPADLTELYTTITEKEPTGKAAAQYKRLKLNPKKRKNRKRRR
tara:strand:+ start:630 stop:1592 length:963 start_codon:yes stop_codon:yes gene_type:complete